MEDNKEIPKLYGILFIIYYIINFIILIGISLLITFLFLNPYLLRGKNIDLYSNNYCNNEANKHHDLLCTNKFFNYKKSKFIWISIDGTATDQLVELHNLEKYKITTSFLNSGKFNKYTNMLYESMMTGKYNKNMIGKEMKYDNFIRQIIQANYKISHLGWTAPFIVLSGKNLSNKFYNKINFDEHEVLVFNSFCNMTNLFPFLKRDFVNYLKTEPDKIDKNLEIKIIDLINKVRDDDYFLLKNISKNMFFEELDNIFIEVPKILLDVNITECLIKNFNWNNEENISIIYYSTEQDTFNHYYGKNHIYSLLNAYITEKMIINIMKWIDEHPDYALIFNSDHGGQHFYGEDTLRNHGENYPGNEGIFYIYTNDFKNNFTKLKMNERYINILDESALIAEILININIPLESKGIPYQLINDEIFAYSSLKRKEIQLIELIKAFDKDNKNKDFQRVLNELNISFNQIDEIKDKYFDKENITLMKELKEINKNNLEKLINQQNKINELIEENNHSKINIIITIILILIIIIKAIFEFSLLLKLLINVYFNSLSVSQKIFLILFSIFYLYIIELLFLFFSDSSEMLRFFIQLYIFITCIILLIIKIFISNQNLLNLKIEKKIYNYFLLLLGFLFFQVFSEYSYSYNSIKSFFSRYKPQLLLNILFLYPLLIIFSINEIKKYNFKNINNKGKFVFEYIIMINILFIIAIYIEDISYKTYYYQNTINLVSMYIAIIIYIIYLISCFIINSLDLTEEDKKQFNISNKIELQYKNTNELSSDKIIPNLSNASALALKKTSLNILSKGKNTNLTPDGKNLDFFDNNNHNNFMYLKLCIIQGIFWLSDESEKIYLFIGLIFYEYSSDIIKYLYKNINTKNLDQLSSKNNNVQNISIISIIFYIIIEKIIINMNQIFFLLIIHSYDFNSSRQQQQKFIKISTYLGIIISYISNFKFSFLTAAYYFDSNIFKKELNKKRIYFSISFILKRIIINLRMNNSAILLIFHSLIKIKEEKLWDFCAYYLEDFIFFFFDYIFVIFACVIFKLIN